MWLTLALPFLILHLFVSDTDLEFGSGGWPFLYYIFFLLYGFVTAAHERLQANIQRRRWFNLALGVLFSTTFVILKAFPALAELEDALGDLFWILSACSLLPTFLGFGMQHLTSNTPFLKYASEAVMGFYILHQTVLLIIGYFVVQWNIPSFAKWAVIAVSSFVVIMTIYEYVVRRVNILRFLCGMKTMKQTSIISTAEPRAAKVVYTF
jgi:ABC-type branched-subunit amino acid transport system permease subunit